MSENKQTNKQTLAVWHQQAGEADPKGFSSAIQSFHLRVSREIPPCQNLFDLERAKDLEQRFLNVV